MFNKKLFFPQPWEINESAKAEYQEKQVPGTIPNIPLASLRITESDCTLRPRNEQKGLFRNNGYLQRPTVPPKPSASFDSQMPPRVGHQQAASQASTPKLQPSERNGRLLTREDTKFLFQPLDRPTSHCESPTGLLKPMPISYSEWRKIHGVSEDTNDSVQINGISHRQMSAKKYILDTKKPVTYSDSHLMSNDPKHRESLVKNKQQRKNTLLNSVRKPIATLPEHSKSLFPNVSDTGVSSFDRIQMPHTTTPDDVSSNSSSSDHTLVGNHSLTTEETLTEERLRELIDSGEDPSSSPETVCTIRTSKRSPSSEKELFYVAPQSQREKFLCQKKDKTSDYIRTPSSSSSHTGSSSSPYLSTDEYRGSSVASVQDNVSRRSSVTYDSPPLPPIADDHTGNKGTPKIPSQMDNMEKQMMHWAKIGSYVRECYQKSKICDVRFYVENEILYAHRAPLCTVSPYFASMFYENNFLHSKPIAEVRLRGISMQSLKIFMEFVYSGKLEITTPTLLDLVKISGQFEVPEIRQRCINEIDFLHEEDLIQLLVVVREDPSLDFTEPLLRCIADKFLSVCVSESFLDLDVDTLCLILSNDGLLTHSEMDVFCAGMKWVDYCPEQRSQLLELVMKYVRFPLMTQTNLFECLEMSSILRTNERSLNMIHQANWIRTAMELNRDDPLNLDIPLPRGRAFSDPMNSEVNHTNNNASSGKLMDISFGSANSEESCATMIDCRDRMEPYSTNFDQLQYAKETEVKKSEKKIFNQYSSTRIEKNTMIVVDKKVYVIGGFYQDHELTTPQRDVWLYSPKKGWQCLAPMKISRVHHTVCAVDGFIYAIGGLDSNNRLLTSVERYDPVTDSWRFVRSMPTARAGACAAELNGHLFVAGGYGDSAVGAFAITDIVECYDPFTNRWMPKSGLRFGRCNASLTRVGDTLYLSGGLATDRNTMDTVGEPDVDIYDAKNDRWRLNNYMLPDATHHITASFASGSMLYLIGGLPDSGQSGVECLDTRRNVWLEDFPLPKEVLWMQRVTSRDVAYF